MKTIFRNLGLGILMAGCAAVSASGTFAQDAAQDVCKEVEPKQVLYKQFTDNIPKNATLEQKKVAVKAGDEYLQKYGACEEDKQIVDYLNTYLPGMKDDIKKIEGGIASEALFKRFNTAVQGTNKIANPSETYASGKEVVALNPDSIVDVLIVLGSVGLDQAAATPAVDTYNNDTIQYAKQAIQKIEANTPSKTGNYGVYQYSYKTPEFPDGKSNALGALNYNIGYITYYRQGKDNPAKKKEALDYFYKATQYNSFSKKNPFIYQTIGAWYLDEAIRVDKERAAKLIAAGNKDTDETLAMVGIQKGYADRAIDAYARAYKLAKDDKNSKKEYVDGLYTKLKELYAFRYDGKTDGIDAFVATVQSKPMPDPSTAITPVKEETPPAAATTTSSAVPVSTNATVANTTKAATPAKAVSTTTATKSEASATSVNAETTTTAKPKAKKPAPKKKGTR